MTYNSRHKKQSKLVTSYDQDDDYIYPTKKIRETKTRNRRSAANQIKAGLFDYDNPEDLREVDGEHDINHDMLDSHTTIVADYNESLEKADNSELSNNLFSVCYDHNND